MKNIILLNDGEELQDGEELHRQSPESFPIPSEEDKLKIEAGALVAVFAGPERLRLEVTEVDWPLSVEL
jgi:hypothetical protein